MKLVISQEECEELFDSSDLPFDEVSMSFYFNNKLYSAEIAVEHVVTKPDIHRGVVTTMSVLPEGQGFYILQQDLPPGEICSHRKLAENILGCPAEFDTVRGLIKEGHEEISKQKEINFGGPKREAPSSEYHSNLTVVSPITKTGKGAL